MEEARKAVAVKQEEERFSLSGRRMDGCAV